MRLLALDPGETTGYALFDDGNLQVAGEFSLWRLISLLIVDVDRVVCERFALYARKAAAMTNNEFPAVQVIGVVRYLAETLNVPVHFQPASAIHSGGSLSPLMRPLVDALEVKGSHARDATAHGLWYVRFGKGRGRTGSSVAKGG